MWLGLIISDARGRTGLARVDVAAGAGTSSATLDDTKPQVLCQWARIHVSSLLVWSVARLVAGLPELGFARYWWPWRGSLRRRVGRGVAERRLLVMDMIVSLSVGDGDGRTIPPKLINCNDLLQICNSRNNHEIMI